MQIIKKKNQSADWQFAGDRWYAVQIEENNRPKAVIEPPMEKGETESSLKMTYPGPYTRSKGLKEKRK